MFYMEQNNKSTAWLNDLFTALGFTIEFLFQAMIIGLKLLDKAWREVLYMLKISNGIHCISIHGIQCECFHQAQIIRF